MNRTPAEELHELYRKILGCGLYAPNVLFPRMLRKLLAAGYNERLQSSKDFANLSPAAAQVLIDYLRDPMYGIGPDVDQAARLARRAS